MRSLKKVVLTGMLTLAAISTMTVLSKATTVKVTGDTLNVRKEPSTSSSVIAMLSEGVECELIEEDGDWYKITYKNYTGYISKQYSEIIEDSSNDAEQSQENQTTSANDDTQQNQDTSTNNDTQSSQDELDNQTAEDNNQDQSITIIYKKFNQDTEIRILPLIHSSKIGSIKKDEQVILLAEVSGWSYIQADTISGWVRSDILSEGTVTNSNNNEGTTNNSESTEAEKTAYINEEYVNLRKGAGTSYSIVKVLGLNAQITILGEDGDWYQVKSGSDTGYVSKEFVSDTKTVTSRSSTTSRTEDSNTTIIGATDGKTIEEIANQVAKGTTENSNSSTTESTKSTNQNATSTGSENSNNTTTKGTDIVAYANQFLGYKYVYGGDGSNGTFDCSGFTMYVYKHFGISLPHGATSQYNSGKGTKISKQSELQVGDIVFLTDYETGVGIGHCGIYIGNGNFIHASTTTYTVTISSLNTTYAGRFYAGLRLI